VSRGTSSGPNSACHNEPPMSYEINIDLRAHDDIAALPADALEALAEAMTFLQLTPWNAAPINPDNPTGPVRTLGLRRRQHADPAHPRRPAPRRPPHDQLGPLSSRGRPSCPEARALAGCASCPPTPYPASARDSRRSIRPTAWGPAPSLRVQSCRRSLTSSLSLRPAAGSAAGRPSSCRTYLAPRRPAMRNCEATCAVPAPPRS